MYSYFKLFRWKNLCNSNKMTIFVARNSNIVPSEKSDLYTVYHDMPGRIERAIKNHLIHVYSRKRYYEYHNGTRPMTPDVERYVLQTLKNYGWTQEPQFAGYVEEFLW